MYKFVPPVPQSDYRSHFFFAGFFQTIQEILKAEKESSLDQNDEDTNNEAAAVPHDQLVSFRRDSDIVSAEL